MGLIRKNIIVLLFVTVTLIFSLVGFNPQEVVIGGPYFPQIEYFEEELELISKELIPELRKVDAKPSLSIPT